MSFLLAHHGKCLPGLALWLCFCAPMFAGGTEAISKPSQDVRLSFARGGQVGKVLVKEGDVVKQGQELVLLEDSAEQLQVSQLKAQADDDTRVRAAQAQLDQKKADLKKTEDLSTKHGAASTYELEHARLDVLIAELSLELARFERSQDQRKCAEAQSQLERMKILSPIAGRVETLSVKPGESAEGAKESIRVVQTDPLWVDAPVRMEEALKLSLGQSAKVTFQGDGGSVTGKLIHKAAVADAASNTLIVRVEIANPTSRPAGERVSVEFPAGGPQ